MRLAWAAVASCLALPSHAVEVSPIYGLQVLGGQYFYGGEKGTLSGNVNGVVAPAIKFDERWALLPSLNSAYQGTKQVVDLVGAGTMFQEQMDHRLAVKGVYTPEGSRWRLKPSLNLKWQLLKETKDEDWGKGLFDYRKWGLGFEGEFIYRDPFSARFSLDYYQVNFPNYISLESQAGTGLSRELASARVLDNRNLAAAAVVEFPVTRRLIADAGAYFTYTRFPSQHVVDGTGNLINSLRDDVATTISAGVKMPTEMNPDFRLLPGLSFAWSHLSSDQNNYDAQRTQFTPFYYNYNELRLSPSLKALIGPAKQPVVASVSGTYSLRRYPHRLVQDATGVYQSEKIDTSTWMMSSSLTYPMAPHFSLMFNVQYGRSWSNQRFEQYYKYNYSVTNYLFGFTYDY